MEPQTKKEGEVPEMLDELTHQFKSYANTLYELYLLKAVQKVSSGTSSILVIAISACFAILLVIFLGVGTAIWLNQLLDHPFCGYFIVSGLFALLAVVIYGLRKKAMKTAIQDVIISEMFKD